VRLSIDPGTNGTGWASWDEKNWRKLVPPLNTGVIFPPRSLNWQDKVEFVAKQFEKYPKIPTIKVYIEYPAFHESFGGEVVARSGALVKLTYLVGFISSRFPKVLLVPVRNWKGQLPKTVVEERIRKLLGPVVCSSFKTHIWDAVGIGLYAKGFFK